MSAEEGPHSHPISLADFEILRRLGAGGMAEVFLAKKRGAEGTYKVLVVKRILPHFGNSRRFKTMFVEEAKLATRLNHPNVVQVYEFFDAGEEGQLLSMEYVEGPDLGHLMASAKVKGTRLPPWVAAGIIAEAAKGLHYAHEKKDEGGTPLEIVHRDVSPQNVLLSFDGAVKIADFGIASARLFSEETGVLKGKFGYMSPEQARGEKVDRKSDVYALGVILWECLAGRPLHGGLGGEALLDIVRSGIIEPPSTYVRDIPPELETLVLKALAPRAEDRFATARDLAGAVARALLQKQVLVDASVVEGTIALLVPREKTRPGAEPPEPEARPLQPRTQAAAPAAINQDADAQPLEEEVIAPLSRRSRSEAPREVRHVALMTLRLHMPDDVDRGAMTYDPRWQKALEQLRTMLSDMAYKRGMRWVWTREFEARAIAGVASNPSKAAESAAWLALDTHEAIAGMEEDLPAPITASMSIVRAIASGSRDPEGNLVRYLLHEPADFLASTLMERTPVQKTWVTGGVYRQVRRQFHWGDAPTLTLDTSSPIENLPANMRVYALERSLTREEKEAESQGAHSDLIGRDAEKAELLAAYHAAANAEGSFTCRAIIGELGIGKTALVSTFLDELPPNNRVVLVECSPARMEAPMSAVAEIVRHAIAVGDEQSRDEVASMIMNACLEGQTEMSYAMALRLAELATNQQGQRIDDEEAHYRRKLLSTGLRNLLGALAAEGSMVFVLEGLQWADKPSLELLSELIHTPGHLPMLLLLVTRPDDRVLPILEGQVRIELKGLSAEEQIRLVENHLNVREGVRNVCADILPRVGGNPFFLLEMVDALLERGVLEQREDKNADGELVQILARSPGQEFLGLPSTLEQLLADRLQELPREEHEVLDWLAIAGGPLHVNDLVSLTRQPNGEPVIRLCARGLCDNKGDAIDFRHPLTRDVAYQMLSAVSRARMHRTLGEHLAAQPIAKGLSAAIVARHLARGESHGRAGSLFFEAAEAARNGYQTQLAIRYYRRALHHLPASSVERLLAHDALEALFRVLGRRRDRVTQLEAMRRTAKRIATPRAVCLALLRTARFDLDEGRLSHGLPLARKANEMATEHAFLSMQIEAAALTSELLRELGDMQGALAASDHALAACARASPPASMSRLRADVLRSRGILLRRVGRVREAVDAYVEAIALFRKIGARRQEARTKNSLAYAMFVQGEYEDAIAMGLESIQIDLSIGGRFQLAKTLTNIGHCYARIGDLPRANAYLARARETHERYGDQDGRADTLIVSAEITLELGDLHAAEEYLKDATALTAVTLNAYDAVHAGVVLAALERAKGNPKRAIEHALIARRAAEEQALVAYQFYGLSIEALARVEAGEAHTGTLLATTALGAIEALQGCEYGLEIRLLCREALMRAGSPELPAATDRALIYAKTILRQIRDPRFRHLFSSRPQLAALFRGDGKSKLSIGNSV